MQESSKTLVSIVGSSVEVTHIILRPTLHEESRPMFNSNQAFLFINAKVEISPRGLYISSQGFKIEKIFSICPRVSYKLLITTKFYGLVLLAPRPKTKRIGTNKFGKPIWNPYKCHTRINHCELVNQYTLILPSS
jgi:hypothetical protein